MHTKNVDGQLHGLYLEALCDGLDNALNPYRYVFIAMVKRIPGYFFNLKYFNFCNSGKKSITVLIDENLKKR